MPYKPMKRRDYDKWLRRLGYSLQKASIDWGLMDENGHFVCTIKVTHPGNEIPAHDVRKTEKALIARGLM